TDYGAFDTRMAPSYRHWPDDGRSSRAVLRILRRTTNLEFLAVKAVEFHHRRITFADLGRSISSRRLRTLSLSGNMSGRNSATFLESLISLLRSPPCARLDEAIFRCYSLSSRTTEWSLYQDKLPPITKLWMGTFTCQEHRRDWSIRPCMLPTLLRSTLKHYSATRSAFEPFQQIRSAISSQTWPVLTSICIAGCPHMDPATSVDLSTYPNLRHLEVAIWNLLSPLENTVTPFILPPHLTSLGLVVPGYGGIYFVAVKLGVWLHDRKPIMAPRLESLHLRMQCTRDWHALQFRKVVIAALALRERSLSISADIRVGKAYSHDAPVPSWLIIA
ncbi:hypothetical protein EXIGLDRAFT_718237, partial [Exidia glandulosa HHB12029]